MLRHVGGSIFGKRQQNDGEGKTKEEERGLKIITTVAAEEDWKSRRKLAVGIGAGVDENLMLRERRLNISDIS